MGYSMKSLGEIQVDDVHHLKAKYGYNFDFLSMLRTCLRNLRFITNNNKKWPNKAY